MSQQPLQMNSASSQQASNDDLQAAIDRHVKKSAETVARIPSQLRTILSKSEAQARNASNVDRGQT